MNVPRLRFDGFDTGIREVKLKEIATVLSGKRLPKGHSFKTSGIPYISVSDMGEIRVKKEKFSFISSETEELIKKYKVSSGDIIISIAGTLGKVNIIDESMENANLTENCNKITVNESEDTKFIFYYLKSEVIQKKIKESSTTSSQPKLALDRLRNFNIRLPSLKEQKKISCFLELLSQRIEKQQEKIEKLEQFKKGMMQKIFSQELRFKDEDGVEFPEWEEKKLGQILKIKHGRDQKKIETASGKFPILATGGVIGRTDTFIYDKESVLIGRKGTIDRPVYMDTPFWTVDTLFYSEIKEINYPKFIFYVFQNINWKLYNEASGVPSLSAKTIEAIKIAAPGFNEQKMIADYISIIDKKIEKEKEKLMVLGEQKRGVMQGMLV